MRDAFPPWSFPMMRLTALALLVVLAACGRKEAPPAETAAAPEAAPAESNVLQASVDGQWRSAEDRSRDQYRHPQAALEFWGLQPGMTILEVQPGGGWWTEILAPYAHVSGGAYYATAADLNNPELSEGARKARADFEARFAAKPDVYGPVQLINFGAKSAPLPENKFDFILSARSVHGWMGAGVTEKIFKDLYGALKPGGVLAIEQHRANPGPQDPKAANGYVTEQYVIEQAQKAGFELAGRSEINANPKDTKDHPFGVWTLPPTKRTRPYSEGPDAHDPKFDRTKYDAIGESDRMTLKFTKPVEQAQS
jgi:predicted methyltransferase